MSFRNLFETYHDKVQFLNIYIREAHPIDGWWFGRRLTRTLVKKFSPDVSMDYYDPETIEERRAVAKDCETALKFGIRTYVDEMDDYVNKTMQPGQHVPTWWGWTGEFCMPGKWGRPA